MFDDLQNEKQASPVNPNPILGLPQVGPVVKNELPKESLEDIFAETEKKEKPPVFQKKPEIDFDSTDSAEKNQPSHQKIFFLVFLVLALLLIGVGSVWGYRYIITRLDDGSVKNIEPEASTPVVDNSQDNAPVQKNDTAVEPTNNITNETNNMDEDNQMPVDIETVPEENADIADIIPNEDSLDSDGDGLTDAEEWQIGTAVDNVDTDNDGLFDREEVKVYKTNPKIADSDGDGYSDGDEVKGGYNPLGSGKLFEVNQ